MFFFYTCGSTVEAGLQAICRQHSWSARWARSARFVIRGPVLESSSLDRVTSCNWRTSTQIPRERSTRGVFSLFSVSALRFGVFFTLTLVPKMAMRFATETSPSASYKQRENQAQRGLYTTFTSKRGHAYAGLMAVNVPPEPLTSMPLARTPASTEALATAALATVAALTKQWPPGRASQAPRRSYRQGRWQPMRWTATMSSRG